MRMHHADSPDSGTDSQPRSKAEERAERRREQEALAADLYGGHPQFMDASRHINLDVQLVNEWRETALAAMTRDNVATPKLFVANGNMVSRIVSDRSSATTGRKVIQTLSRPMMRQEVRNSVWCYRFTERKGHIPQDPPDVLVDDLLAYPNLPFPYLDRIVHAPVFSADGELITTPGYNRHTETYYAPFPGVIVPDVPFMPTSRDVDDALAILLDELLCDFPFASNPSSIAPSGGSYPDLAHVLAAMLQPFVRNLIGGQTPFFMIESPAPGTGKTTLARMILYPVVGSTPPKLPAKFGNEPEMIKNLTSTLRSRPEAILIDNIKRKFESGALADVITSGYWRDRELGTSNDLAMIVRNTFIGTGNTVTYDEEMVSRVVPIRLNANVVDPTDLDQREPFKNPFIDAWIKEHHGQVIWACLVVCRHGLMQMEHLKPADRTMARFEHWSQVMGGILRSVGIHGFLEHKIDSAAKDARTIAIEQFGKAWATQHPNADVTTADLYTLAESIEGIWFGRASDTEQTRRYNLGRLISSMRGRRFTVDAGQMFELVVIDRMIRGSKVFRMAPTEPNQPVILQQELL